MKLLTQSQKKLFVSRNIKEGEFYPFPVWGFHVYAEPNFNGRVHIDSNPFTKSLSHESFIVKQKIDGFCRGNFKRKPLPYDMFILESDLAKRGLTEILLLLVVCPIPMVFYNLYRGRISKIEKNKKNEN